jgi:hypothetical protein
VQRAGSGLRAHLRLSHRLRSADGLLDALKLLQMVAEVDDVEPPPLVGAHGPEEKVRGGPLGAELLTAVVEEMIHSLHFLAKNLEQLVAIHGRPGKLARQGERRSGRAARHVAKGEDNELPQALAEGRVAARGSAPLDARLEDPAGTAAHQHQVLDDFLCTPVPIAVARMKLATQRWLFRQLARVRLVHFLKHGMHDETAGSRD